MSGGRPGASAQEILRQAVSDGRLVRSPQVSASTHPDAERTYLADGSGLAWSVPPPWRGMGRFAVDGELIRPVRPVLVRRYGIENPEEFARCWTRAEALAKIFDIPIVTWLSRHGLDVPATWDPGRPGPRGEGTTWAWRDIETPAWPDLVVCSAVRLVD